MKRSEFNEHIKPWLEDAYPDYRQVYGSSARLKLLWEAMRYVSLSEARYALERILETENRCPLPNKVRASLKEAIQRERDKQRREAVSHISCEWCSSTGFISGKRIGASAFESDHSFRCPKCKAAEVLGLSHVIPLMTRELFNEFEVKPLGKNEPGQQPKKSVSEIVSFALAGTSKPLGGGND